MKAAVTSVQPTGTYPSEFGILQNDESQPNFGKKLMHKFEITIGEHTGEYATNKYLDPNAKDFPFVVGVETDYEFVDGQYPKIKIPKKDFTPSNTSRGGSGGNRSFALSYAKDVLVSSYMTEKPEVLVLSTDQMFDLADKMNDWLNEK